MPPLRRRSRRRNIRDVEENLVQMLALVRAMRRSEEEHCKMYAALTSIEITMFYMSVNRSIARITGTPGPLLASLEEKLRMIREAYIDLRPRMIDPKNIAGLKKNLKAHQALYDEWMKDGGVSVCNRLDLEWKAKKEHVNKRGNDNSGEPVEVA